MKNFGSGLWQLIAVFLTVMAIGVATPGQAKEDCSDFEGLSVPCANQQPTLLQAAVRCTDLDGFTVPCRNQEVAVADYRDPCIDSLADRFSEGQPIINRDKCPKENAPILLSQGPQAGRDIAGQ